MSVSRKRAATSLIALVSSVLVVAGTYLPWAKPAPRIRVVTLLSFFGRNAGLEAGDSLLIALAVASVIGMVFFEDTTAGLFALLAGGVVAGVSGVIGFQYNGYLDVFVPAIGVYLTLLGGIGLLLGGGVRFLGDRLPWAFNDRNAEPFPDT